MNKIVRHVLSFLFVLSIAPAYSAVTFNENFDSGLLNPLLQVAASPGFSFNLVGGLARFDQVNGASNGSVFLTTKFEGSGDFVTSVQSTRLSLDSAELGLFVDYGAPHDQSTRADIFFVRGNQIGSNIAISGTNQTTGGTNNGATSVTLQISRVGSTITTQYDAGSGFQTLNSRTNPGLTGPATFSLFLIQEFGSTAANSGSFDNWTITVSSVPEPSAALLACLGLVGITLCLRSRTLPASDA